MANSRRRFSVTDRLAAAFRELEAAFREEIEGARLAGATATPDRLLSVREACEQLGGISRTTFYQLVDRGELRTLTCGRRRLVPQSAIDEYAGAAAAGR